MGRPVKRIQANADTLRDLHRRARAATSTVREKERATIILLRLDGKGVEAVAEKLKTTAKRVSVWSKRFDEKGLGGLEDKPGRGRRPSTPRP
jgi:transposase